MSNPELRLAQINAEVEIKESEMSMNDFIFTQGDVKQSISLDDYTKNRLIDALIESDERYIRFRLNVKRTEKQLKECYGRD
jgi:hypothetical protein